jgi:ABC-2 type transport system ATP-binding protein
MPSPATGEPVAFLFFVEDEMSDAVIVHNAYKKFGNFNPSLWKRKVNPNHRAAGKLLPGNSLPIFVAVDHVSFSVSQGEIFGLVGPQASGKSTLIRMLATLLLPDDGELSVYGYDVASQPRQVQRLINRVSGEASFFKKLSPLENLVYSARLYEMEDDDIHQRATDLLIRLGVQQSEIHLPMEAMSREQQQKAVIAHALLPHPRLLLLDEPAVGLSIQARQAFHSILRELRDELGITILYATRRLPEIEALCDRFALLQDGKLLAINSASSLIQEGSFQPRQPGWEDTLLPLMGRCLISERIE